MSERKSKNIVIIALCITLIFMGIGYAYLSTTLTINGTANVKGTWNVRFSAIEDKTLNDGVNQGTNNTTLTGLVDNSETNTTTLDVNFDLVKPGDSVSYLVTVENVGNIEAALASIEAYSSEFNEQNYVLRDIYVDDSETALADLSDTVGVRHLSGLVPEGEADTISFLITYTLNPDIVSNPTEGQIGMPPLTNGVYTVTDTLHFNFQQA